MSRRPSMFSCTRSGLLSGMALIAWGCSDPAPVNTAPPFEGSFNPNSGATEQNVASNQGTASGDDGSGISDANTSADGSQGNAEGNPNADNATGNNAER